MNAYELADWLTEHSFLKDTEMAMMPVINMLRQQADKIAELEKQCEPIAIVNTNCENNIQWYINDIKKYNGYFLFVNAQTKPLSDEEIEEVINKHWNREYGNRNMLTLCKAVLAEANK